MTRKDRLGAQALEDAPVGVCLRSEDGTVQFQNRVCRDICGEARGRRCDFGCQRSCGPEEGGAAGFAPGQELRGGTCDLAVVGGGGATVALLRPLADRVEKHRRFFASMGLTDREVEIAVLAAIGKSNAEIVGHTKLSKATVRTHLNHIHQKLPDRLLMRVRARKRGSSRAR